jgi:hypothetical protein
MYLPSIESARVLKQFQCGSSDIELLDNIVASGLIEYNYIMVVRCQQTSEVSFMISSERGITGEHFLCIFDEEGHHNFGDDDKWADIKIFEQAALEIVARRLGSIPVPLN